MMSSAYLITPSNIKKVTIMTVEFSDEINRLESTLKEKQQLLTELRAKRDEHSVQTRKARRAIDDLRAVLRGEKPPSERGKKEKSAHGVTSVPVNDETGRPARGARREQIQEICKTVGANGEIFRTADVLKVLRKVENDITPGMRSYTYTVMNALEKEGKVERQGRGKWTWEG